MRMQDYQLVFWSDPIFYLQILGWTLGWTVGLSKDHMLIFVSDMTKSNATYLPESRPPTNLIVVSKREIEESSFELSKSIDGIHSTTVSTILGICITRAVLKASTALAPQPFL